MAKEGLNLPRERTLWIIDQYAVPTSLPGFVRQFEHAQSLQEKGWNVRIIASPFNHKTHLMDRPVSPSQRRLDRDENGIEFSWIYSIPYQRNNWRRYLNMLSFLMASVFCMSTRSVCKPDVILASSPHLFTGLAGWLLCKRYRIPLVFEVRDLWPESLVQLGLTNPFVVKPLSWLEKFLYSQSDAIVSLTDGIGTSIRSRIAVPQKVQLIPNGSNVPKGISRESRGAIRSTYGWENKYVVGWVGAHGEANHLDTLVDASEIMAENGEERVRIVLIGDGPEKQRLMARGAELANLQFMDPVPKSEVVELLQSMDAGVIVHGDTAAVRGARPNKLFDYMAAGLPIVSDLQGETARILEEAGCGRTVPSMEPLLLARALQDLSEDLGLADELGLRGREYLQRTHDRSMLAAKLESILIEL